MEPIIDQYETLTGHRLERVNIDDDPETTKHFGITAIPAFVVVQGDNVIYRKAGLLTLQDLKTWLAPYD